ncbi:MAG: biotin/lipoyl-binding protein [Anaerolineales bacterium]|nr:biotin/lipoyl-binding protein [Anaerolineales bacterium]NUQ86119.1 biotin/lipoyl-binding protein [Anaerolineales bacterium]
MKYNVTIQDKSYVVEIEDINARPVIAYVEGIRVEVIPDTNPLGVEGERHEVQKEAKEVHSIDLRSAVSNPNELIAPLPGTVVEVFVRAGDVIEAGQVVVVIEAMKMKNSIRSTRAGKIAEVCVGAGDTVAHKQPLVRFEA